MTPARRVRRAISHDADNGRRVFSADTQSQFLRLSLPFGAFRYSDTMMNDVDIFSAKGFHFALAGS